jgi:hypothetical protein
MADDGLQFDKAEFQVPPGAPEQAAAAGPTCAFCRKPLARYWAIGDQLACGDCHELVLAQVTGGSPVLRFARATAFGLIAATLGALLYFGIVAVTGYELGLVAIVVGLMVGAAVAKGADHRGGWVYQLLAVALTYTAIVTAYVPMIAKGIELGSQQTSTSEPIKFDEATLKHVKPSAMAWVIAVPFAFVAPFLAGAQNFMGWIIIAIGLYEAWRRNTKLALPISGPHDVAPGSRGTKLPVVPAA